MKFIYCGNSRIFFKHTQMKNLLKPLLVVGAAGLAWLLLRKKTAFDKLRITIQNIQPDVAAKVVRINCMIVNPTLERIDVRAIAGGLSVGSSYIGKVLTTLPNGIQPGASIVVPLEISVTATDVIRLVVDYLSNRATGPVTFFFDGNVNVSGAILPLKMEYTLAW